MSVFVVILSLGYSGLVVSSSASDRLERLELNYNALMGTLNPIHSLRPKTAM